MWPASTWKASANIEHLPLHSICSQNILWSLLKRTKQTFSEWNLCIFCMFNNSLGEKGDPIKFLSVWPLGLFQLSPGWLWIADLNWIVEQANLGLGQPLCLIMLFKPWWKKADLDVQMTLRGQECDKKLEEKRCISCFNQILVFLQFTTSSSPAPPFCQLSRHILRTMSLFCRSELVIFHEIVTNRT